MKAEVVSGSDNVNIKIMQWGHEKLESFGYTLKRNLPENVLNTPWSYVVRFETSDGHIYLKQTPQLFALEPTIIQILHDQFHARVPTVIAHNAELNCLDQIKKHHGLTDNDESYLRIKDACFKKYMNFFESKEQLTDALETAKLLHRVYGISYQYRFMMACGKEKLKSFQHWKLSSLLKEFMALCN